MAEAIAISPSPNKRKAVIPRYISLKEYFEAEERSLYKNEYHDGIIIKPEYFDGREDTITNPRVIVEVLSTKTKNHDRTLKFDMYRTLPSFKEYVLIYQDRKQVSVYSKQANNIWLLTDYDTDDSVAIIHNLNDCPLPLKRLYRRLNKGKEIPPSV